jgi:hypothetical protein
MTAIVRSLREAVATDRWWKTINPDEREATISPVCCNPGESAAPFDLAIRERDIPAAQRAGLAATPTGR